MDRITLLACGLLAAVALIYGANLLFAPDLRPVQTAAAQGGAVATPNHDPHRLGASPNATTETAATEDVTPPHVRPTPSFALSMMTLRAEPEPASLPTPSTPAVSAAVPSAPALPSSAADLTPTDPAPALPAAAPAFSATNAMVYAKGGARLRASPSATAFVLTRLPADLPLRAVARSTDGAWWQVALAGGRTGYVHRDAVNDLKIAKAKPSATASTTTGTASAPVFAVASPESAPRPRPVRRDDSLRGYLDYMDQTMTWLADQAGGGAPPKIVRSER